MKKSKMAPVNSSHPNLKVTAYWGDILYDTALCGPNESITVGTAPGNTFVLDVGRSHSVNTGTLKLIEVTRNRSAKLQFNDKMDGHIRVGKELLSFRSAKDTKHVMMDDSGFYQVSLSEGDKADFVFGHVSFYIDWVKEFEIIPRASEVDRRAWISMLVGTLAMFVVVGLLALIPTPEPEKPPERLVTLLPRNRPAKAAMGERKSEDGGAQKGETGKAETKTAEVKATAAETLRKANLGSIVSGLSALGSKAPSAPSQTGASAAVAQTGTSGFTSEGLKAGAGGKTVGIGRAVGSGEGGFEGTGRLGLSGNSPIEGGTGHGEGATTVGGGLDPAVIESVIRRRLDRIRLCYERQLNFNPKLAGKISVHFVIGAKGEVASTRINEDTMNNQNVRSCILEEVKTWTFPAPEGGTLVNVDYPFVFESSAKGGE